MAALLRPPYCAAKALALLDAIKKVFRGVYSAGKALLECQDSQTVLAAKRSHRPISTRARSLLPPTQGENGRDKAS
jgi:hypothetical protein